MIALGDECGWLALFRIGDEVRPEAIDLIVALKGGGLRCHPAHRRFTVGGAEGGCRDRYRRCAVGMSPQGKYEFVRHLQSQGAMVAMVGDGVNNAPVLAQARLDRHGGGTALAGRRPTWCCFPNISIHWASVSRSRVAACASSART